MYTNRPAIFDEGKGHQAALDAVHAPITTRGGVASVMFCGVALTCPEGVSPEALSNRCKALVAAGTDPSLVPSLALSCVTEQLLVDRRHAAANAEAQVLETIRKDGVKSMVQEALAAARQSPADATPASQENAPA